MSVPETLWCQAGAHEWIRTRTRGRKPQACPDHTPNHHRRRGARRHQNRARAIEIEEATRPFDPLYTHLADAVLALHTRSGDECAAALRRLAGSAELLSLDPRVLAC